MRLAVVSSVALLVASAFVPPATRPPAAATRLAAEQGVAMIEASELLKQEAIYDLIYVERLPPAEKTAGGLILLAPEDPPMHLARVVSVGTGQEGEAGQVTSNRNIAAGDLVYLKFPWGIGPRDEQCGEEGTIRRFSFIRYQDVAAVVKAA
eukprot:CAMPEP_0197386930 /NCGR_PEP_ID=MMETSP1165-20131217/197_1 /TAXON_ID=284809 /ORGANISM="Chrysocystis fragilis, Strain CCMP3189" /LENGTH=150 /DNA_ID=CAMNT_0042912207 /DNA_START=18 /DNA_END=470 /DNA_ORIENTATION=+